VHQVQVGVAQARSGHLDHHLAGPCRGNLDVDELGLDRLDRAVLDAILTRFEGGPVGLNTLAVSVGEEADTIESVVEPFLVRIGLLSEIAKIHQLVADIRASVDANRRRAPFD
jgi:Holliday junction resolvasome RuvABC ATP-dependent DNA helicase subunit